MTDPFRQEGERLEYGPYSNIPPFKLSTLSVHFAHDTRFAVVMSLVDASSLKDLWSGN